MYGDGLQYRSLIHVHDVARALVQTLEKPRFMRSGRIFHVGEESNNKTVREIAELIQANVPGTEIDFVKGKPTDRRDYRINCSRVKNSIGWEAQYSVEDGIKELLEKLNTLDWDWESPRFYNSSYDYE